MVSFQSLELHKQSLGWNWANEEEEIIEHVIIRQASSFLSLFSCEYLNWLGKKKGERNRVENTKIVFSFIAKIFDKLFEGYIY